MSSMHVWHKTYRLVAFSCQSNVVKYDERDGGPGDAVNACNNNVSPSRCIDHKRGMAHNVMTGRFLVSRHYGEMWRTQ